MGKLIGMMGGMLLGLAAGGYGLPVLGILGLIAGAYIDIQLKPLPPKALLEDEPVSKAEIEAHARGLFARYLATLFVRVCEVDGELTREEVGAIRDFFQTNLGFDESELEQVRRELHQAREEPQPLSLACAAARELLRESELSLLYYALWQVAAADHPVNAKEERVLGQIATELHLDPDVEAAMRSAATPRRRPAAPRAARSDERPPTAAEPEPEPDVRTPYERLGLKAEAGDDEVKRAYRALAQKLHPDKVAHLGAKAMETAARAFSEVNLAYEEIRKQRGL